jgi:flagellin
MLSLHTNTATLSAQAAMTRAVRAQSVSSTRLSTGYRVNSAMDDAAGLQIATRLRAQSSGMRVAQRNIQNGISLMQTADSVADGMISIFGRMKDLAVQAADGASTDADKAALQAEFVQLFDQAWATVSTKYAGQYLFVDTGGPEDAKFFHPITFQIGDSAADTVKPDLVSPTIRTLGSLAYGDTELKDILTAHASQAIGDMSEAIDGWASFRSAVGAVGNMLEHAYNNLSNQLEHTMTGTGRIVDIDYAEETAEASKNQMLAQVGTSMLRQTGTLAQLTLSLIST